MSEHGRQEDGRQPGGRHPDGRQPEGRRISTSRRLPVVEHGSEGGAAASEAHGTRSASPASRDGGPPASGAPGMDRRHALKVMAIAAAAPGLASCAPDQAGSWSGTGTGVGAGRGAPDVPNPSSNPRAAGTLWDPDLIAPTVPWERTLEADELATLAVLCDLIIPADGRSPSASQVGAHEFIDEWVSAPYEGTEDDCVLVRGGLVWLDAEAARRFGPRLRFRYLSTEQRIAICDDICSSERARAGYEAAARFFERVRDLTSTAFWTTEEGMRDLEYVGNVPLSRWDPPPPEVLRHIGLE